MILVLVAFFSLQARVDQLVEDDRQYLRSLRLDDGHEDATTRVFQVARECLTL